MEEEEEEQEVEERAVEEVREQEVEVDEAKEVEDLEEEVEEQEVGEEAEPARRMPGISLALTQHVKALLTCIKETTALTTAPPTRPARALPSAYAGAGYCAARDEILHVKEHLFSADAPQPREQNATHGPAW